MTTLARSAHPAREWRGKGCTIKLDRPRILGILNLTPDSFYDGGRFVDPIAAVVRAEEMVAEGVDVIDIGGESTRPGAPSVGSQEELDRVLPVIERLRSVLTVPISIDTNKSGVADAALRVGANYVNDISGLQFDADMASVVAAHQAGLVVMHTRGRPDRMQLDTSYDDLAGEVYGCLEAAVESAVEAGIPRSAIAVDPGIGFGKSVDGNLELQRRLPELLGLGCPVLLGTSRKSFIGKILDSAGPDDRLAGTLATVAVGVLRGAMLHRVHDVAAAREAAMVAFALS
ncbi:MAG: dihydropteroate synthase [Desulfuromonas sp.]|nr:MAG: dihydropteroate synthase [Desulfuromonas sp.]